MQYSQVYIGGSCASTICEVDNLKGKNVLEYLFLRNNRFSFYGFELHIP